MPVTGIMPRVMPTLMKIWKSHMEKIPQASRLPKASPEEREIISVLYKRTKNKKRTKMAPTKPSSSPMTEKMKSV